jgi:hypothetical protein
LPVALKDRCNLGPTKHGFLLKDKKRDSTGNNEWNSLYDKSYLQRFDGDFIFTNVGSIDLSFLTNEMVFHN